MDFYFIDICYTMHSLYENNVYIDGYVLVQFSSALVLHITS